MVSEKHIGSVGVSVGVPAPLLPPKRKRKRKAVFVRLLKALVPEQQFAKEGMGTCMVREKITRLGRLLLLGMQRTCASCKQVYQEWRLSVQPWPFLQAAVADFKDRCHHIALAGPELTETTSLPPPGLGLKVHTAKPSACSLLVLF